jgi:DNA polymerase elongation subunit (family B)
MSYVDAYLEKNTDTVKVVERVNGKRVYNEYPAQWMFYYDDPKGKHRTIYNTPVSRFSSKSSKLFQKELRTHRDKKLYESDLNPVFRCLEQNYQGQISPDLHLAFFDIETDFDPKRGFAPPEDPFSRVTAISVHLGWLDKLVTLVMPPRGLTMETAQLIASKFDDCYVFDSERDLLETFLQLIDDADILSGWNSEGFDIPYLVNRIKLIIDREAASKFCLWNQLPKAREYEKFGNTRKTYDLIGRVHLDYLELYRKYTYHEMHSYRLDAIGEHEVGENKIPYEGSLDQLYNNDFEKFIAYNRQDTALLKKIDDKLKFIELSSELAHDNTVLLQTTMGAVAVTEQAIINLSHKLGLVVPDRKVVSEDRRGRIWLAQHQIDNKAINFGQWSQKLIEQGAELDETNRLYITKNTYARNRDFWSEHLPNAAAAGAFVADPKRGLHDWIGAIDINSLYPSVIRALNMSPETIIGQLRPSHTESYLLGKMQKEKCTLTKAWEGLFGTLEYTSVINQEIGTEIIVDWEDGRSEVRSAAEIYKMIYDSYKPWVLSANGTIFTIDQKGIIPELLRLWFEERKELQAKKKTATDNKEKAFWDKRQLVKKINLNSLYGAILNPGCRFNDMRIGQSTTLTGRCITRHMGSRINQTLTTDYSLNGDCIIYGDTDSVSEDSIIKTSMGEMTIEQLFHYCNKKWQINDREFSSSDNIKVLTYNDKENISYYDHIKYVYRHKVTKQMWEIEDDCGNIIKVTEDHSIMIERDGTLLEIKPNDLLETDILIQVTDK